MSEDDIKNYQKQLIRQYSTQKLLETKPITLRKRYWLKPSNHIKKGVNGKKFIINRFQKLYSTQFLA